MIIVDNLKLLGEKKNRLYLVLVIWLMIGDIVIQFYPLVGIVIFLPFLAFVIYLFILALITKKDVRDYSKWKLILLLILLIPIMVIMVIVLFILFAISIISYIFMTSWFILYGIILISKKVDSKLHELPLKSLTRSIEFFGGIGIAGILLVLFYLAPTLDVQKVIFETEVPVQLNYVYLVIGIVLFGLAVICVIIMFKKSFNAWFGIFSIVAALYAFFLAIKIILGLSDLKPSPETSIITEIGLLAADLFIIVYAVSTLLGSKAEVLVKQLKYFGIDTVFIWLLFSKASYEFVVNFPYEELLSLFNLGENSLFAPFLGIIDLLNADFINLLKNIAVLAFFLLLLILLGFWEIRKYNRAEKKSKYSKGEEEIEKLEIPIDRGEIEENITDELAVAMSEDQESKDKKKVKKKDKKKGKKQDEKS